MKALQGKKPGLRYLWGKALVVFCLVALVFAGCSDGSEDSGGGGIHRGKEVLRIEVLKSPDYYSLEGMKVDLRGIEVLITYTDQTWTITRDHTLFHTVPNLNSRANFGNGNPSAVNPIPIPGGMRTANYGNPVVKDPKPAYRIGARGVSTIPGYEPNYISMALAPDYIYAEYRVLDYYLVYNHGKGETKYAPLRISGVYDLEEINFLSPLPKKTFYIDDVVDLTGLVIEMKYNDGRGLFLGENGAIAYVGDYAGTPRRVEVPYDARWDWSLNYPRSSRADPYLRINMGNRLFDRASNTPSQGGPQGSGIGANTPIPGGGPAGGTGDTPLSDADYRWEERVIRHDYELEALYIVDGLEVTKEPSFLTTRTFYNDEDLDAVDMRAEWFKLLKDAEITVSYVDTKGNPAPDKKKILVDAGGPMTLPMAEYFTGNGNGYTVNAQTGIVNAFNGNVNGPPIMGTAEQIRGGVPGDPGYNPNLNWLVFVHQNVGRRNDPWQYYTLGDAAQSSMLGGWELNQNPDMVRRTRIGPVKVYTLDTDGFLTVNPGTYESATSPDSEVGSYAKMMKTITVEAPFIYRDGAGNPDPSMPDTTKDVTNDYRLQVGTGTREPIIVDNIRYDDPKTGLQQIGWWTVAGGRDAFELTFTYRPFRTVTGVSVSTDEPFIINITDPNVPRD